MKHILSKLEAFTRDQLSISEQPTRNTLTKATGISRRHFLSGSSLLAVGSIATFGVPEVAMYQKTEKLGHCWNNQFLDATWTRYGHLSTVVIENQGG